MADRKNAKLVVRLPQELLDAVKEKSQKADIPVSQYVRHCLRRWVAQDPAAEPEQEGQPEDTG